MGEILRIAPFLVMVGVSLVAMIWACMYLVIKGLCEVSKLFDKEA